MAELITYAYIRSVTAISANIPDDELQVPLKRSQDMLKMILGTSLYDEIVTQFDTSFTALNTTLHNPYIKEFLAWQSYQFWLPKANFKTTPAGLRVHSEDNSTPASDAQMATLYADAKQQAQFYKGVLVQYLTANKESYPLYDNCHGGSGTGFHITSVGRGDNIHTRINKQIDFNG